MSGHSKWSTIKHKKAKTDAQRGKIFTKLVREIVIAAKVGGADPEGNPRLKLAIQKARQANMPSDNIKRAVQKGAGNDDDSNLEEVLFEGYAPFGVAILVETLTDNRNRTVPNLRSIFTKFGGSLGAKGSVAYLFNKQGIVLFEPGVSEESVMDVATEAGADDIDTKADGSIEVLTAPEQLLTVKQAFDDQKLVYANAELMMIPTTSVALDLEQSQKIAALIEKLEDDDDVQNVYTNADLSEDFFS
ncbi:MAG: YebC/PmpR family DNA-binding transcriptional regulator [Candidatus Margulisiibacteriota bacterium]